MAQIRPTSCGVRRGLVKNTNAVDEQLHLDICFCLTKVRHFRHDAVMLEITRYDFDGWDHGRFSFHYRCFMNVQSSVLTLLIVQNGKANNSCIRHDKQALPLE